MVKRMPAKRICEAASPVAMPKSGLPILITGKAEPQSAQLMSAPRTRPGVVEKKPPEAGSPDAVCSIATRPSARESVFATSPMRKPLTARGRR